jgi:hypothetical protein
VATLLLCAAQVRAAPRLGVDNFSEVGDGVTDMLSTSGLTFAALDAGSVGSRAARLRHVRADTREPGDTHTIERPCPAGGSVRVTSIDADGSGDLSAGDRFTTVFMACAVDDGIMTGRSSFVVSAHRFKGEAEVIEFDFNCEDLGTENLRWNGLVHLALRSDLKRGTEHYRVSYRDLAVRHGERHMRWNFSLDVIRPPFGSGVAGLDGEAIIDGIHLWLRQDEIFIVSSSGLPNAGQLTAGDDHGARLQVEAGRWRYTYRLFLPTNPGDAPDSVAQSKPYLER